MNIKNAIDMKRIVFIIMASLCIGYAMSQKVVDETVKRVWMDGKPEEKGVTKTKSTLPYKPLSEFGKDTIEFFHYNFYLRADQYEGKTINDVLKDAQLKPLFFSPARSMFEGRVNGLIIYFNGKPNVYVKGQKDLYIYIEIPMPSENVRGIIRSYDSDKWVPQHEAFFGNGKVDKVSFRKD